MKISTKTYYGLRAMVNLANKGDVSPIADIAYEEDISESFLEKILQQLRKAGLVKSHKGAAGGYQLAKEPKDISINAIFSALDEDVVISFCPTSGAICPHAKECTTAGFLTTLERTIVGTLEQMTLAELIAKSNVTKMKLI